MVPEYTRGCLSESHFEFDIDFEFDAPRFYDFSRPELDSETQDIEIWFQYAGNYPPSRKIHAKNFIFGQRFVYFFLFNYD